jgi:lipopolysaccharide export system permease protein
MEMVFPFLLSTGVITTILMMNQIFEFIPFLQSTGVELDAIFQMILFSLPPVLMISVPISLMIGIYAGISRLSADSELIVMRASGVSLSFFFKPALFMALLVAAFVLLQTFFLGPLGVRNLEELKYGILKKQTRLNLSVQQINNFFGQKLIYIFEKDGDLFKGIFISDWSPTNHSGIIEAQSGKIFLNDKTHKIVFQLYDGKIHNRIDEEGYRIISFKTLDYDLTPPKTENKNVPSRFNKGNPLENRMDTELTMDELYEEISTLPTDSKKYYEYIDEFHARIVTVLSCLCFAIFALPMGIYNPRSPKAGNIVYMVLVLITYFFIYARLRTMVTGGDISAIALYLALVFIILNGAVKYYKINQNIDSLLQFAFDAGKRQLTP